MVTHLQDGYLYRKVVEGLILLKGDDLQSNNIGGRLVLRLMAEAKRKSRATVRTLYTVP